MGKIEKKNIWLVMHDLPHLLSWSRFCFILFYFWVGLSAPSDAQVKAS